MGLAAVIDLPGDGPKVIDVSPRSASVAGDNEVLISGEGFTSQTTVRIGRRTARIIARTPSTLTAVVPAQETGTVRVEVSDAEGTTRAGYMRIVGPPLIDELTPNDGKANRPVEVTIRGTDLDEDVEVRFGELSALEIKRSSPTELLVVAPALDYGIYPVTVTTRYGSSAGLSPAAYQAGTAAQRRLKVGSFNVRVASGYAKARISGERPWKERLPVVAQQILDAQLDIVGIQEASPSAKRTATGVSQYTDLIRALGGTYKMTSSARGCNGRSGTRCANGGSGADRIIYDSARLKLVAHGSRKLDSRGNGNGSARYMGWAVFEDKRTDAQVFFVNTHLEPKNAAATRARQARLILSEIAAKNPSDLPTILVGDLAATKFSARRNIAHTILVDAGFVDPLVNTTNFRGTTDRVTKAVNVEYGSLNNFKRAPERKRGFAIGSYVDYILVKGRVTPHRWETVVNLNASGRFAGVVPSDHNLITLSVALP